MALKKALYTKSDPAQTCPRTHQLLTELSRCQPKDVQTLPTKGLLLSCASL